MSPALNTCRYQEISIHFLQLLKWNKNWLQDKPQKPLTEAFFHISWLFKNVNDIYMKPNMTNSAK